VEFEVPHARLKRLEKPMVAFGLSKTGIDWNAPDGLATHYVFLILTPEKEEGVQVQILASIARAMEQSNMRGKLMYAENEEKAIELLNRTLGLGQFA
jgi:PTS system nitrogen regulatory IIA component